MDKEVKNKCIEKISFSSSSSEEKGEKEKAFVKSDAEKRFLRKLNIRMMPLVVLIIILQNADKSALSNTSVLGMLEDNNISHTNYSILGSLFYLGYIIFQLPNSYLLQKLPLGKYLGVLLICWGTVTMATAFGKNFIHHAILRVLLGLFESGGYPTLMLILNTMYRRSEQSLCFGFLYIGNGLAGFIAPITFVGITNIGTVYGIKAWQWCYIIWGIATVVFGFIVFIFFIDNPESWALNVTGEERIIVEERKHDNAVVRKREVDTSQYWEALKEPRCWLLFIASAAHTILVGGMVTYSTILIKSFGFDSNNAILLKMPGGVMAVLFVLLAIAINRRTKQIVYTAVFFYIISATGCLLLAILPHSGVKLAGYYLFWAANGAYVMLVSIIGSTVSGYSKKIFYNTVLMFGYTIGNFCGPLILVDSTKPKYLPAMWSMFAVNGLCITCVLIIRLIHVRINKKRAPFRTSEPTDIYLNLTDKQDKNYIYSL